MGIFLHFLSQLGAQTALNLFHLALKLFLECSLELCLFIIVGSRITNYGLVFGFCISA